MNDVVAIYKTGLLPSTQTFIPAQMNELRQFRPVYVGLERVAGGRSLEGESVVLAEERTLLSRVHKVVYKLTGIAPRFHRRVATFRPRLLHAHFSLDGVHALRLASNLKLPLVVTLHAHLPTSFGKALHGISLDNYLYSVRLPALWRKAGMFICVSDFIRQRAIQLGYPASKLIVHYIGVDRRIFKRSDRPRDPHLVVFVGRLVERKGVPYLIQAMAQVQQTIKNARVAIIGSGPDRPALEQLAKDLKVNAEFLGGLSDPEMRDWLSRARIFAGPSITASDGDAEALGMVFAEAQATGLPVVSCYHGGVPEVVCHGDTGLLAPERDSRTLAEHISRLLSDQTFWQQCSDHAASWIEERFDLIKQTHKLEQIYLSLLK